MLHLRLSLMPHLPRRRATASMPTTVCHLSPGSNSQHVSQEQGSYPPPKGGYGKYASYGKYGGYKREAEPEAEPEAEAEAAPTEQKGYGKYAHYGMSSSNKLTQIPCLTEKALTPHQRVAMDTTPTMGSTEDTSVRQSLRPSPRPRRPPRRRRATESMHTTVC